jgi:hypothetical protein
MPRVAESERIVAMATPGFHAFDFIYGNWHVHNRKLRDVTVPTCEEWVDFDATSEAYPILEGMGHVDRMYVPDPPDGGPVRGLYLAPLRPWDGNLEHLVELHPGAGST